MNDNYIESIVNINDNLSSVQRAQKKYYDKMKNDPNYVTRRRNRCMTYYNKIKDDDEFKRKKSEKKKAYYQKKKVEILLEIIV